MTDISPVKRNIQIESVQNRASVSEAVGSILGSSINFINTRQTDQHSFNLNGDVSVLQQEQIGDGFYLAIFDMELTGYSITNGRTGTSGTTVIDLHLVEEDGTDSGTLFTSKPSISTSAADESSQFANLIDANNGAPTGHTLGVFSNTLVDQGQKIRLDLDSSMSGSENLTITIYYRPR